MKNNKLILLAGAVLLLVVAGLVAVTQQQQAEAATKVLVYKTPTCGCCSKWVDHMRDAGFDVETRDLTDLSPIKANYGVQASFGSCHTAVVGGYVVEGHVPAAYVQRLLDEKPDVAGLAVPGMPMGSPGMEGAYAESYDVLTFDRRGRTSVFGHVEAE